LWAAAPLGAGEIRIWPTGEAAGEQVRLSDVAELRGFDPVLARNLADLAICDGPKAGGESLIYPSDIRAALSGAQVNLADIHMLGAARCKVRRPRAMQPSPAPVKAGPEPFRPAPLTRAPRPPVPEKAGETLEAVLRQHILSRLGDHDGRIEIRFSTTHKRDLQLEAAGREFRIVSRDPVRLGLVALEVAIAAPAEKERRVAIVAEVSLARRVVVARRGINRGETISVEHLKLEERRFQDLESIGLTDLTAAMGRQPRELIRPGQILRAGDLEEAPLVRRGDAVTIWIQRQGLVIKAAGRAQKSGRLGETIEVSRDGTRRKQDIIEAVVTGSGTVTLRDEARLASGE